jgi:ABC-type multidrug transport system ATPase subunit
VTKYYGIERVVHKFNLNCYEGDVTALIGGSGCGKTTILKIIAGLIPPSSGQITVSRQDLLKSPTAANSFVGYSPQKNILYPHLTVDETLAFYCKVK